ncbi:hypothetical protein [Nonomuraea fuscirosea]|uniref:hypothetical protein n=1 Tax=Nonomuraea fuscirosea TaxID=1291556 RepID=UPI003401F2B9
MQIRRRDKRPRDLHIRHVVRPAVGDPTPALVVLSSPHKPFQSGIAYQAFAYVTNWSGLAWWEPAGSMHVGLDCCLADATARASELRGQDNRTPFDPPLHWAVSGLLMLAYELAPNGPQKPA